MHNIHLQRLDLLTPHLWRMTLGLLAMLTAVAIQLSLPKAVAYFIDNSVHEKSNDWLTLAALIMSLVFIAYAIASACRYYLFESAGTLIVARLRHRLFSAIIAHPISFFDHTSVGDLTSRLSTDAEQLQDTLTMGLAIFLRSLVTFIGGLIILISLSPMLAILLLVVVPLAMWSARWAGKMISSRAKEMQTNLADCNQKAQESLTNIRLVHAFTQQRLHQQQYQEALTKASKFSIGTTRIFASFQGLATLVQYMALLVTLWFGGQLVSSNVMTIGELTSFIMYAFIVATSASGISWFWGEWMKTIGATERLFELIEHDSKPSQNDPLEQNFTGNISFRNIEFHYPTRTNTAALSQFNLSINAGEIVAIVGPSGAGKSTIASLLLGLYQSDSGNIYFDDIKMSSDNLNTIRQNIAIVEQEPTLFSGTIMDNIRYGTTKDNVSEKAIIQAAIDANADQFIRGFADGYQTQLGERGVQLSGGQKQRIAIARAILRNTQILILDEATSALDSHSEHLVQEALQRLMQGRTTITIAHRFSTIANANRVIVMDKGKIRQEGSHQLLMQQKKGLYYELVHQQSSIQAAS